MQTSSTDQKDITKIDCKQWPDCLTVDWITFSPSSDFGHAEFNQDKKREKLHEEVMEKRQCHSYGDQFFCFCDEV